nr:hypothetical protein RKHAN_00255 [Rhizobium sp. Khangiran2]
MTSFLERYEDLGFSDVPQKLATPAEITPLGCLRVLTKGQEGRYTARLLRSGTQPEPLQQ